MSFAAASAVAEVGPNTYEARLDRAWWVVRGPNGGYLTGVLVRAMEAALATESGRRAA